MLGSLAKKKGKYIYKSLYCPGQTAGTASLTTKNETNKNMIAQNITELKSQIDARDVIGEYVELKGTGDTRSGKCPFHEDRNASLVVGREGYRCMACGESGDPITFVQKHLGVNFKEAVVELARKVNMSPLEFWEKGESRSDKPKPKPKEPPLVPIPACPSGEWDRPRIIRIEPIEKTESGKGPDSLDFSKVKVDRHLVNVDRHFWYDYSSEEESKGVVRLEYTQDGKREKNFRQLQKVEDQWRYNGKGIWEGYREREIIAAVKKKFSEYPNSSYPADLIPTLLSAEGEKCAEALHQLGLPCLTHRGSAGMKEMEESFSRLKELHPCLIVVHLEDNDEVGARKGQERVKAGAKAGLAVISIPTARLANEQLCEKGDVVDVLENMNEQEFINRLEREIHEAVAERQRLEKSQEPKHPQLELWDLVDMELAHLAGELNLTKQMVQLAQLAQKCGIKVSWLKQRLREIVQLQRTPECKVWRLDDFMKQDTLATDWLIPGFLPRRQSVILTSQPKVGKTLMAIDLAYSLATGDSDFLGEMADRVQKVLLVSVDEEEDSTRHKLWNRGFRPEQDLEQVRLITQWNISQLDKLEEQLEEYRPDLVVIDSLRRINLGNPISENSPEFADRIYLLKELCGRYGAASILVHHSNKDSDKLGVDKVRGSSAIAGSVWGVWELKLKPVSDPDNPKKQIYSPSNPGRSLYCFSRDAEGLELELELDSDTGGYKLLGEKELGDEDKARKQEQAALKPRIKELLERNTEGLFSHEVVEMLGEEERARSVKEALSKLVKRREISTIHMQREQGRASHKKYYSLKHTPLDNLPENSSDDGLKALPSNRLADQSSPDNPSGGGSTLEGDKTIRAATPPPSLTIDSDNKSLELPTGKDLKQLSPSMVTQLSSDIDPQEEPADEVVRKDDVVCSDLLEPAEETDILRFEITQEEEPLELVQEQTQEPAMSPEEISTVHMAFEKLKSKLPGKSKPKLDAEFVVEFLKEKRHDTMHHASNWAKFLSASKLPGLESANAFLRVGLSFNQKLIVTCISNDTWKMLHYVDWDAQPSEKVIVAAQEKASGG